MELPDCFDCKYGGLEHPCRAADGRFDFDKVGTAIVAQARAHAAAEAEGREIVEDDTIDWITDCLFETIEDHPHLLIPLMVAAMDACEGPEDAACIAAGLVESSMVKHGPALIGDVEALAARSAKFSYILSGVWSQGGRVDPDVWVRLGRAVARHPRMGDDPRAPSDGSPMTVLNDEDARTLMHERVSAAYETMKS